MKLNNAIILIDALGYHYFQYPLIKKILINNKWQLIPLKTHIGYSPGLHMTIWSGISQRKHGIWSQWILIRNPSDSIGINKFKWLISYFSQGIASKIIKKDLHQAVPVEIKRYFSWQTLFDYRKPHLSRFTNITIFNELYKRGIGFLVMFIEKLYRNFSFLLNYLKKSMLSNDIETIFIISGDCDYLGHKYGPQSYYTYIKLYEILKFIQFLFKLVKPENIYIFGDHGMSPINGYYNIYEDLIKLSKRCNIKIGKDMIFFIDSTIVRLWLQTDRALAVFNEYKKELEKYGKIIDYTNAKYFDIPIPMNMYGDVVILAKNSMVFYPSFWLPFNIKKLKGAHGYLSDYYYSYSCLLTNTDIDKTMIDIIDLRSLLSKTIL